MEVGDYRVSDDFRVAAQEQTPETNETVILAQSAKVAAGHVDISCEPVVTIESREEALRSSWVQMQQAYNKDAYELSFWTDACLPGSKITSKLEQIPALKQRLCGFCVVHHRWDVEIPRPGEPNWDTLWWLSGYVAAGALHPWPAEAMAVNQALRMAISHCEQVSGTRVTCGRPRPAPKRILAALPRRVNIFCDHMNVLKSLAGMAVPTQFPESQSLITTARDLTGILSAFGVGVNFRWVPGHAGDPCNSWAHEGARIALIGRARYANTYSKCLHRVMVKVRRLGGRLKKQRKRAAASAASKVEEQSHEPDRTPSTPVAD